MRFNPVFAASVGAIAALAVGVGAFAAMEPRAPTARSHGPALQIALVAPVEPEVRAGAVMEVGELQDGYEHRPFVQAAAHRSDEAWLPVYEADIPPPPRARWTPVVEASRAEAVVVMTDEGRERPLSFGFDRPRPDYAEERRHRHEAMERRLHERREMQRRDRMDRRFETAYRQDRSPPPWVRRESAPDRLPPPPPSVDDTFY